MYCTKCGAMLPPGAKICPSCGKLSSRRRGNGQGSVYKLPNGKYKASVTLGYYLDEKGKRHRQARTKVFDKKKDAIAALPSLAKSAPKPREKALTFKELFDLWLPTHRSGEAAITSYKAAVKHFRDIYSMKMADIEIEDLQECLDSCPSGKATRSNMRAVISLMYKYGIPRHYIPDNLNLSPFLRVEGESAVHRVSFSNEQIELIRKAVGTVPYADYIYFLIYTGFRSGEFLSLTEANYDSDREVLIGGSKTEAGKNRVVTISPKIMPILKQRLELHLPYIFGDEAGKKLTPDQFAIKCFYPALEQIGIENPIIDAAGGAKRHKYTPHSCRHTFSTLMKRTSGSDKDKLELIGHTSSEMLRYYQDVSIEDLKKITDAL